MKQFLWFVAALAVVCSMSVRSFAQESDGRLSGESEESERLQTAVSAPSDSGLYKGINELPERIRKSAPFARALDEMTRRAGTSGTYDVEQRIAAFEKSQADLTRASAAASAAYKGTGNDKSPLSNAWTNIGVTGTGAFSAGCTTALAINPSNPSIMYAGATSGGVWKSTDAGAHWTALTDLTIPNLSVASIAIDPSNPSTLYVGTGNGYASVDELSGTGLYRSTDAGGTFTRIGGSTLNGTVIKVLVHPTKSNIIFASLYSGNKGVYRSTDAGSTWSRTYTANAVVWDIIPGAVVGGTTLFYFVEGSNINATSSESGVYKSVNEGSSWSKITSSALPASTKISRSALAVATKNPSRIFTLMTSPSGDTLGLYASYDNGITWTSIGVPATLFNPNSNGAQGWYDVMLGVTPNSSTNHDTIYVGGVEAFVNYSDGNGWRVYSGYYDNLPPGHVDHHSIAFNPNNGRIVYDGSDGGVFMSTNAGVTWSYRSTQMVTNRIYHLGFDPSDSKTTLVGLQDQGTWKVVTSSSPSLRFGGDGFQPIVSSNNSSTQFAELPNGVIYKTVNNGQSYNEIGASDFDDQTNWNTPVQAGVIAAGVTPAYNVLFVGRQKLWRSLNEGISFTSLSPVFSNGPIQSIGQSSTSYRTLFVGLNNGIQVTTNGGTSWASRSVGLPAKAVTSIVTTGRDTGFVLASFYSTTQARVMMSTNNGNSWANVSGSSTTALPAVGVNCVALDSVSPKTTWYAATDNGIYYTMDAGAHWSIAGSGIGLAVCRDVQVHKNKTTIRVATFGRGLWEANTNTLPVELSTLTYQKTPSGTQLIWHTDSERGNSGFAVERSVNGDEFTDVGFVQGVGTSSSRNDYNFFDTTHSAGTYLYQLKQIDLDGTEHFSNRVELHYGTDQIIVYQNYPNPFLLGAPVPGQTGFGASALSGISPARETRFRYELPDDDMVSIKLYSSTGALIRTLLNETHQSAGEQDAFWDGTDDRGLSVSSGAYFYVIETGHYGKFVNKLMLIHN